jgi:deoxyribodipyrimidine photo-lyase
MQAYRRMHYNHSLDFAVRLAKENNSKLIIYEGLRKDYPWSSPRLHKFILEGMCDNYEDSKKQGFTYWSYVEEDSNPARGLLKLLSKDAVAVVTDDFPSFIIPEQTDALSKKIDCTLYSIDGNSIIPIGMYGTFASAARILRPRVHLLFSGGYQNKSKSAYKLKDIESLQFEGKPPFEPFSCNAKDIDSKLKNITFRHPEVKPFLKNRGGRKEALKNLKEFLSKKLSRYHEDRNQPGDPYKTCVSLMSPYLHFGHISQEEIVREVLDDGGEEWKVQNMNMKMKGKRDDIYSKRPEVNSYLDELITWRDIGYHLFWQERSFKKDLNNLPGWAKENMKKHAKDKRKILYSKEQLDQSLTHDVVWNAAQKELKLTGRMHNYLRMLWGKKIIEWTPNYQTAFEIMEDFNNLYAYDGRNPNSYTGILWCFGLFDRPWFPERDVFGVFRYMSSDSTVKKLKMAPYYKYLEDVGGNGENLFIQ